MPHQAGHDSGAPHRENDDGEVVLDVSTDVPAVPASPGAHASREPKRVEWKNLQLEFDQVEADGYGYAHDPKTNERFMLASSTPGRPMSSLSKGKRFLARVTKAHFVTAILDV